MTSDRSRSDPVDSGKGVEKGLEIFYRMQFTQALMLVPDIQYWNGKDTGAGTADAWIFCLRLAFAY